MSKVIKREFTIQTGYDTLPPVTLGYAWSSFMNQYAVWQGSSDSITIVRKIELQAGNYYVVGIVDNYGSVNINGQYNINLYNYGANISRENLSTSTKIYHPGGQMTITISATNTGGPRGVGVTISKERVEYQRLNVYYLYSNSVSIGDLVWSTRSAGTESIGRYAVTMPFRANVGAYVWGAGGGGGGMDAGSQGGLGSPGLYNEGFFEVERGDVLEVFVGEGGRGGSSNSGGAPGGRGGFSRVLINGSNALSLNGGAGTAAGPSPYSGGGGGGGGASGVMINNQPVIVAGGGGGGGGAGNDGNGSGQYARRDASISKNATGSYRAVNFSLDLDSAGTWTKNDGAQVGPNTNFSSLSSPASLVGTNTVCVFGWGSINASNQTRTIRTNSKIDLTFSDTLTFYVNKGTESNWGQNPDSGEDLHLEYSQHGTSWTVMHTVPRNVAANTWLIRTPQIPVGAKVSGGVFLRFRQTTQASSSSGKRDTWAFTSLFTGSPVLDLRGENGQSKGGDGGGAGGGGGGYPGGQGGPVAGGDASGFSGSTGGNYPDNVGVTTGTTEFYYKGGFGAGGARGGGSGQNGRVFLEIRPLALNSVKNAGEWKQITESFVKISGSWKSMDSIYVKINNTWKLIEGSGQGDVDLPKNSGNWSAIARSYS